MLLSARTSRFARSSTLLILACLPQIAQAADEDAIAADRPDFVESSNVVGKSRLQVETSIGLDRNKADGVRERTWSSPTLLRYGTSDVLEVRMETDGMIRQRSTDELTGLHQTERGSGDLSLGLKWHAVDASGNIPSVGLLFHADLDSGSAPFRGQGRRLSARMLAELELGAGMSLGAMPGVGYERQGAVHTLGVAMDAISTSGAAMKDQLQADMAHDALRGDVLNALLGSVNGDNAQLVQAGKDVGEHVALFRARLASMETKTTDPALKKAMAAVRPDADAYLASATQMAATAVSDKAAAAAAHPRFVQHFDKLEGSMGELSEVIERNSGAAGEASDSVAAAARMQIIAVSLLSMAVALLLGVLNARAITRPLDAAIGSAACIADGDLSEQHGKTVHDAGDDTETGRLHVALAHVRTSLHDIVAQVREGTDAMATASGQIAAGNMDLSARTEMQASSL